MAKFRAHFDLPGANDLSRRIAPILGCEGIFLDSWFLVLHDQLEPTRCYPGSESNVRDSMYIFLEARFVIKMAETGSLWPPGDSLRV